MELQLKNGDYIPDEKGGVVRLDGDAALLQRVLFRLSARRGGLSMLPELGSQLYLLGRERPEDRLSAARQYAAEAVRPDPEIAERYEARYRQFARIYPALKDVFPQLL